MRDIWFVPAVQTLKCAGGPVDFNIMDSLHRLRLRRRGAELIEMTVAFSVLLSVTFGMMEFGQYFYIRHCFEAAVRDGGRVAILPTASQSQMVSTMTTVLSQANVAYSASWLTITDLTTSTAVTDVSLVPIGDQMQITLSANYSSIPNAFRPLYQLTGKGIGSGKVLTVTALMIKE